MKKLLLCLSALFLSVSFATAQETYEISTSTGTLTGGTNPSYEWVSNQTDLTLRATNDGGDAKNISYISNGTKLSLNAYNSKGACYTTTYTISVPQDGGYKIAGYNIDATAYSTVIVNGVEYSNGKKVAVSIDNVNSYAVSFTVERKTDDRNSTSAAAIDINAFTVTLQKEGGEEYTVSATASPAEGGAVTVNGAAEATTTGKVELEAVPAYGYKFVHWTVGTEEVATTAEYTATVSSNTEFVAVFEKLTDTNDWYASIQKPTFTQLGNTTFVKAATLAGDVNAEVTGIQGGKIAENQIDQKCVTNVIEVAAGAEFDLNITYQLNWGDLAIYQIDNDGATKERGYYLGSWEPNGSTAKVVQNLEDGGITVSEIVDGACTATFPITINENHNSGDVIVVRAITGVKNDAKNSAYEQGISEGGYVDFLFVVRESYTLAVGESGYATLFLDFNAAIPTFEDKDAGAYIVTEVNKDYVTLTQVTGVIPAKTGVIVKASEGNYTFTASTKEATTVTGNLLEGTVSDEYIQGEAYVLGIPEGETKAALCKAKLNFDATGNKLDEEKTGTHFLNNANRAYLPIASNAAMSASLRFDFDGTTGVEKVEIRNEKEEIYDLTGRRVNEITKAGVYIVGGRKVLVK